MNWWKDGKRKPHVFPEPVFAMQIMSEPLMAIDQAYIMNRMMVDNEERIE
jgi:hypothetical protein